MDRLFRHLHVDVDLAIKFIATFSRFECALKSTVYDKGDAHHVKPAWSRFAIDINTQFLELNNEELNEAKRYLYENPPKVQVKNETGLIFIPMTINANLLPTQQFIEIVSMVRNNLFHGGKYAPDGETDSGRNKKLVQASLIILEYCYKLNPEVKLSFER